MSVQTVVIDVFQTNKKLKEFDKNVDRLGKSLEKMQKQMERLSQEKRSTGLSQGDTLMKSLDKMTSTMTRIFSNGIKLNNPTVTAKVTVDFSKMNLAGQMGMALKNADIAGMIIRNMPRSRMTMPEMKIDMPKSMKVEVTNEVKVKLPKASPSDGKTPKGSEGNNERKGYLNKIQNSWKSKFDLRTNLGSMLKSFAEKRKLNSEKEEPFISKSERRKTRRDLFKNVFGKKEGLKRYLATGENDSLRKKQLKMFQKELGDEDGLKTYRVFRRQRLGMKIGNIGEGFGNGLNNVIGGIGHVAKLGIGAYTGAVGLFISSIKAATSVVKFMAGVFQKVAGVISAVWGQAQQWVFNPMVQTQNQISENKGYKMLLGGEDKAIEFDNSIFEMSEKSSFSHEALDSGARMFLSKGVSADETKRRLSLAQDTAAAFSLDDSGFQEITNGISQLSAKKNVYIEDVTQGFGNTIPTLKLITEGINKEAKGTKKSMDEIKDAIENGDYSGGELVEALLKGMETYGGTAEEIANTTFMGLKTKISNIFKSNVLKNWGKGLSDGFTTGFSKIADFMDKHKGTFEKFGNTLKELGEQVGITVSNVLQGLMERFDKVVSSEKFKSVDLSGKIVILWDEVIKKPLANWWNDTGRDFMGKLFSGAGNGIGEVLTGVICGLMGSSPGGVLSEGMTLGLKLGGGIIEGLDGSAIFQGLVGVVTGIAVAPFESLKDLWDEFCQHVKKSQEEQSPGLSEYKIPGIDRYNRDSHPIVRQILENQYFGEGEVTPIDFTNGKEVNDFTDPEKLAATNVGEALEKNMKPIVEENERFMQAVAKKNQLAGFHDEAEKISKMEDGVDKDKAIRALSDKMKTSGLSELQDFKFTGTTDDVAFLAEREAVSKNAVDKSRRNLEEGLNSSQIQNSLNYMKENAGRAKEISDWKEKRYGWFKSEKGGFLDSIAEYEEHLGFVENTALPIEERLEHDTKMKEIIVALNRRLKAYGVADDDLFDTGMEPEAMRALIEKTEGDFGTEAEEAKAFFEELAKGLIEYANVNHSLNIGNAEIGMRMGMSEASQTEGILNGTSPFAHFFTEALQQSDQLNQEMEGLAKPAQKEFIIEFIYKHIGVPSVYSAENPYFTSSSSSYADYGLVSPEGGSSDLKDIFVEENAKGNILMSPHLSWVAEAGPEAIIPLTGPYKNRGIDLWEKAGQMLGVTPKYAKGGIVGSYEIPKETPRLYQQIEETQTAKETETKMSMPPQIQTGDMNFNFTFHGTDTNSQEEIMKVIKAQMPDIADEIAGTIAVNIQRIFANMQLQTG